MKAIRFLSRASLSSLCILLLISLIINCNVLSAAPPVFQAGASSVDITPPLGIAMAGYKVEGQRSATGIMHPIYAQILVMNDSKTSAAIITLDLIDLSKETVRELRQKIESLTGIPGANIMVASSHTHAGPITCKSFSDNSEPDPDPAYMSTLKQKIIQGVQDARRDSKPVSIKYGEGASYINVNRRLKVKNEIQMLPNPLGIVDQRVRVLQFSETQTEKPVAVFIHFTCHPNVLRGDNTLISPDYPGPAKTYVQNALAGCVALFAQGCTGNIRPNLTSFDGNFLSGKQSDVERFGKILGQEVIRICKDEITPVTNTTIQSAIADISLPAKKGGTIETEVQALHFGDIWFITLPGEPFSEIGMKIEKMVKGEMIVVGYANDSIGYICTEASYPEGGYEPTSSNLTKEGEGVLLKEVKKLYQSMVK